LIKKAITYFILLTAMLYGFRWFHYEGLLRQNKGFYGKYKQIFLGKNNYNVIFLGSSRCEMHYNTAIFDRETGKNSFNVSLKGATPKVAFTILSIYLQKSSAPEYLIYEVDYHFLKHRSQEIMEFNNYFPFLHDEITRKELSKIYPRMSNFYLNPYFSLPYTGLKNMSTSWHGWLNIPNKTDRLYQKGYQMEVLRPDLSFIRERPYRSYFDVEERAYLDSIILISKRKNIKLTLISSPLFGGGKVELLNKESIVKQLKNIALINEIPYYDLSSLAFCARRELFIDHYHMNAMGAIEFTSYFARFFNNNCITKALK
jgi:hypothetical protein